MGENLTEYQGGNELLDLLLALDTGVPLRDITVRTYQAGDIVVGAHQELQQIYFPIDTRLSVTTIMLHGDEVEVTNVGREGMIGVPLPLGASMPSGRVLCQITGSMAMMDCQSLKAVLDISPIATELIHRYLNARMSALFVAVGCNALHSVEQRCARWLLALEQHVGANDFALTQEFLAMMLGVRQATLNGVAQRLREAGYISYSRGKMNIVDVNGLSRVACECFGLMSERFAEVISQCREHMKKESGAGSP